MRVRDVTYRRDVVHHRGEIEQKSLQRARRNRQRGLGQHREQKRERMGADAEGGPEEQDRDQAGAHRLEFCEAEGVPPTGRPTG